MIHRLLAYVDGSVLAQLGSPDVRTPIAVALAWPARMHTPAPKLDLPALAKMTFEAPDSVRFPALNLARQALQSGGAAPTILNAANEVAVEAFLAGRIGFLDIARIVEQSLARLDHAMPQTLAEVHEADAAARREARQLLEPAGVTRIRPARGLTARKAR